MLQTEAERVGLSGGLELDLHVAEPASRRGETKNDVGMKNRRENWRYEGWEVTMYRVSLVK